MYLPFNPSSQRWRWRMTHCVPMMLVKQPRASRTTMSWSSCFVLLWDVGMMMWAGISHDRVSAAISPSGNLDGKMRLDFRTLQDVWSNVLASVNVSYWKTSVDILSHRNQNHFCHWTDLHLNSETEMVRGWSPCFCISYNLFESSSVSCPQKSLVPRKIVKLQIIKILLYIFAS